MRQSFYRTAALGLVAVGVAALTLQLSAQTTNKTAGAKKGAAAKTTTAEKQPAPEKKAAPAKKPAGHPFHGKLAAVDRLAKTVTVGKSVYQITSETKITKGDKPATLADGVIGEEVGGYVRATEDGKEAASSLRFGPKPEAVAEKKATKPEAGAEKKVTKPAKD